MNVSINTLTRRLPEVLAALEKNEHIVLSHEGRDIALLHPVSDVEAEVQRLKNHPAVGMWADRDDMEDPRAWIRERRRLHREKKSGAADKNGKTEQEIEAKAQQLMADPGFGMWADREDMQNPSAWVDEIRRRRREKLIAINVGEPE